MLYLFPLVIMLWVMLYPHPYQLAIACAVMVPWVGIVVSWMSPGRFLLDGTRGDSRQSLGMLLFGPSLALTLRALIDIHVIDIQSLILWGSLLGLPLWSATVSAPTAPEKNRWITLLLMLPVSMIYGGSSLAFANVMWDNQPPEVFTTTVTGKDVSRGKNTTYHVSLSTWNASVGENRVAVSRSYYDKVDKGDVVCVRLHPGKFGLRWMQVGDCD